MVLIFCCVKHDGRVDLRVDRTLEMRSCTTEFDTFENAWIVHVGRPVVMRAKMLGGTTGKPQISLGTTLIGDMVQLRPTSII